MYKIYNMVGTGSNTLTNRTNVCGGDKKAGLVSHIGCSQWTHSAYGRGNNTNYISKEMRMALCSDWKNNGWITMNPTQGIWARRHGGGALPAV
jgi:hypothetical protein